jgi:hypothetical protein
LQTSEGGWYLVHDEAGSARPAIMRSREQAAIASDFLSCDCAQLRGRDHGAEHRIVDLSCQRPGSIERAGLSEARSIDSGSQEELAHTPRSSDRLELVDPQPDTFGSVIHGHCAQGIETIRLDPEISIGEATTELGRVDEELKGPGNVASGGCTQSESPNGDALPAGIADLTSEGKRVLEALLCSVEVAKAKVDLRAKGFWPRSKRGHSADLHLLEDVIEHVPGSLKLPAKQMQTTEQSVSLSRRHSERKSTGPSYRRAQQCARGVVVAYVAATGAANHIDPDQFLIVIYGELPSPGQ